MSDIPGHFLAKLQRLELLADKLEAVWPTIERLGSGAEKVAGAVGLGDAAQALHNRIDNIVEQLKALQEFRTKVDQVIERVKPLLDEFEPILAHLKSGGTLAAPTDPAQAPPQPGA